MNYQLLDEILMYPPNEKGFEIKCLDCGGTKCEVHLEWDESYDETPYISGYKLWCPDCLQTQYQ